MILEKHKQVLTTQETAKTALLDKKYLTQGDYSLMPRTTDEEWAEFRKTIPVMQGEKQKGVIYESVPAKKAGSDAEKLEKDDTGHLHRAWEVCAYLEDWQNIAHVGLGLELVDTATDTETYVLVIECCKELQENLSITEPPNHCVIRVEPMTEENKATYLADGKDFFFVSVKERLGFWHQQEG
jgi:hypothetical protein